MIGIFACLRNTIYLDGAAANLRKQVKLHKPSIEIKGIEKCNDAQRLSILDIRNQDSVRLAMYETHVISVDEHLSWLARIHQDASIQAFVIFLSGEVIGAVSVSKIDLRHRSADWAFYLSVEARGGIGRIIEYSTLNYVMNDLKLEKLNCEVLEFNEAVVSLHMNFGFEHEGTKRNEKLRDKERINVVLLGITSDEWHAVKPKVEEQHLDLFDRYDVSWVA